MAKWIISDYVWNQERHPKKKKRKMKYEVEAVADFFLDVFYGIEMLEKKIYSTSRPTVTDYN